jgi:hypothetical protein
MPRIIPATSDRPSPSGHPPLQPGRGLTPSASHQSLRSEFLADRSFTSLERARPRSTDGSPTTTPLDRTKAIEIATLAERFRLAPITVDTASIPVDAQDDRQGQWVLRRVAKLKLGQMPAPPSRSDSQTHR